MRATTTPPHDTARRCRREGHKPEVTFKPSPYIRSYVTRCQRCGETLKVRNLS